MSTYIDSRGVEFDSAEEALNDFISELPYLTEEESGTVFQFTRHGESAEFNLRAIGHGIVYAGLTDRFAGYPVPFKKETV